MEGYRLARRPGPRQGGRVGVTPGNGDNAAVHESPLHCPYGDFLQTAVTGVTRVPDAGGRSSRLGGSPARGAPAGAHTLYAIRPTLDRSSPASAPATSSPSRTTAWRFSAS